MAKPSIASAFDVLRVSASPIPMNTFFIIVFIMFPVASFHFVCVLAFFPKKVLKGQH